MLLYVDTYTPFFGNAITLRKDDIVDVLAEVGDNSRITKNSFPFGEFDLLLNNQIR